MWGHSVIEMMKLFGTRLICIDPRITWIGTRAEEVVQVRPGTDTALAMAMLNIIMSEEPNLFGNWKSNINVTMPHKVNGKLGMGDCFKNMICKIYPGEGIAE